MNKLNQITSVFCTCLILSACGGGGSEPTPAPKPTPKPTDSTAPVITLNGDAVIQLAVGTNFSDPGASATDDTDGDLSAAIAVTGNVNTDVIGTYTVSYDVSDQAGNAAKTVERRVVVNAIPVLNVSIDSGANAIVDEPKVLAKMRMSDDGKLIYDGNIGIELRGSSSQSFDKKSYGFETWDEQGKDMNVALAGFPEEEDWIFYGPYSDKSLIRNVLIYDLSNQMGRYAVRTKFAEVTINDDYRGIYVLMEKIKRDGDRVAISKLKSEDITGGYIIKIDKTTGEDHSLDFFFESAYDGSGNLNGSNKIKFLYEYPKPEDIEVEEKAYIQKYFADFEQALMAGDFADQSNGYRQYIDTASFIDFFLLNELSHNVDAYRISTFMHKDKGEKLKMGPIWDFNIAFGNANYCHGEKTDDWAYQFNSYCPSDGSKVPFWWSRLLEDERYVAELKARWQGLRGNILSNNNIEQTIQKHVERLRYADVIDKNFGRFPVLGGYVWPNYFIGNTHSEEINYLKKWVNDRVAWMDSAIEAL